MRAHTTLAIVPLLLACACGGGTPAASDPTQASESPPAATDPAPMPPAETAATPQSAPTSTTAAAPSAAPSAEPAKPDFPPHGGVEAAIKAVPQGAARLNMSNDALQKPLMDLKRYDKCKIPHSTKV